MPLLSQGRIHISSAYMANHRDKRDFSVAVVGGGICGLAVAAGLTIRGVDVDIYEAAVSLCAMNAERPLTLFLLGAIWRNRRWRGLR